MNVILFGATGMVGQGVLRECVLDRDVKVVQTVGRSASGNRSSKVREAVLPDMFSYEAIEPQLQGFDACFFCLGTSAAGKTSEEYRRLTYDLTLKAAQALCRVDPQMTFIYVSGAGTDSSERGRMMWARVKGETENALLRLPFKSAYMFRPGFIQPVNGERSKTPLYRFIYSATRFLTPLLQAIAPSLVLTTEQVGRAMLAAVRLRSAVKILEANDIRTLGGPR